MNIKSYTKNQIKNNPELLLNKFILVNYGTNGCLNKNLYYVYKIKNNRIFYYCIRFWFDGINDNFFNITGSDFTFNKTSKKYLLF